MTQVKDPVCGMELDSSQTAERAEYQGATYHFCSPMCKTKFTMNPAKYAGGALGGGNGDAGGHSGHQHNH